MWQEIIWDSSKMEGEGVHIKWDRMALDWDAPGELQGRESSLEGSRQGTKRQSLGLCKELSQSTNFFS